MTKCFTDLNHLYDPYEQPEPCPDCGKVKCICRYLACDCDEPEPEICGKYYDGR